MGKGASPSPCSFLGIAILRVIPANAGTHLDLDSSLALYFPSPGFRFLEQQMSDSWNSKAKMDPSGRWDDGMETEVRQRNEWDRINE